MRLPRESMLALRDSRDISPWKLDLPDDVAIPDSHHKWKLFHLPENMQECGLLEKNVCGETSLHRN
jgi:hypothetical protein